MDSIDLQPPGTVRGMTVLDRSAFQKTVQVPKLKIREINVNQILPLMKTFLLKMEHFKPVRTLTCNGGDKNSDSDRQLLLNQQNNDYDKEILLHPLAVEDWNSLPKEIQKFGIDERNFCYEPIQLSYENWKADEILKSVLPTDQEGLSSYSRIGHIVHINLREHLFPYKQLIGEVLHDKTVGCRTVVNKAQTIDNTYRNFNLELIYGDADYQVEVKEHGCIFEFDFSKVYWNPRLSTEHDRIVNLLKPNNDVLYDVFAGVGPFSIPAAKKEKMCSIGK